MKNLSFSSQLGKDIPAGLVVFLVALPLCLGIALASGAPLISGVIAGIAGGIIAGMVSGSNLGVSGPAAGLTVIVFNALQDIGQFDLFLVAVVLAGIFQIFLGWLGAGKIAYYFPSSVIKGMLAAIGILIILKQIPHALGVDGDPWGENSFFQPDGQTTFSELIQVFDFFLPGAATIGLLSLLVLIAWEKGKKFTLIQLIPGPLVVVFLGVLLNSLVFNDWKLGDAHVVSLPVASDWSAMGDFLLFPDWSGLRMGLIWKTAGVIAIIASIETLLCVEATDRLDPARAITPTNRELVAQGIGNIASGLVGGIPITQVIVRSSANIQAGGKTKMATVVHGLLLLISVVFIPSYLNLIPLASLAAILLMVGYKLTSPATLRRVFQDGWDQFIPFMVTIVAIVLTDLLVGIGIGLIVGIGFVLYTNFSSAIKGKRIGNQVIISFEKDVFFYNRAEFVRWLAKVEPGDHLILDASKASFIDFDILQTWEDFSREEAPNQNITIEFIDISRSQLLTAN